MKVKISKGNMKLGKIPNSSLIPVKDCINSKWCKNVCYAKKAWRLYPSARKAWTINSKIIHSDMEQWKNDHIEWVQKHEPKLFRFFQAGDVISKEHFDKIKEICEACPNTKFIMFTKAFKFIDYPIPLNLCVVLSLFPKMKVPDRLAYLPRAYYYENSDDYADKRFLKALECHGGCDHCGMCWHLNKLNKDVKFLKH